MKRVLLVTLLLCICLGTCLAEKINCYMPDEMTAAMNEILPLVIKALGESSSSRIQTVSKYLSVSYTETENSVIYYNNQDWNVELSFYFSGKTGKNKEADAVNFSVSKSLTEAQIKALIYAFAITVSYDNPEMDQYALVDFMLGASSNTDVYQTAVGNVSYIPSDDVYHYALLKPEMDRRGNSTGSQAFGYMLISEKNFSMELRDIRPLTSKSFPAALEVPVLLVNNTAKTLYVSIENATVNGAAVKGIGIFNIAPKSKTSDEYFILKAETEYAMNAVCNAREAYMDIMVYDSSDNTVVARNSVTLNLTGITRFTPYPSAVTTPQPRLTAKPTAKPKATPKPTAKPTAKPAVSQKIQQIKSLDFSNRMWSEWEFKSGNKLSIRFEMEAVGNKTVKEFELYLYATDSRGNRIYGANQIYYATTKKTIYTGRTAYSDYIVIPEESQIDRVYCGIKRVVLYDGTVEEVPDSKVDYAYWTIQ